MSAAHVLTPARSGVYRTPVHVDAVRQASRDGEVWIDLDLSAVGSKSELLDAVAKALGYPGAFGRNWDALADALQDLSWRPAEAYALHLANAGRAGQAMGADWATLIDILSQTAAYWKARGIAFVALIDDATELPLWI